MTDEELKPLGCCQYKSEHKSCPLLKEIERLRAENQRLVEAISGVLEYQGDRLPELWRLQLRAAIGKE